MTLNLGDEYAATYPFVPDATPQQLQQYQTACRILRDASQRRGGKRGIVVIGQPNSGKTRLVYEAICATLGKATTGSAQEWQVIRWTPATSEASVPTPHMLKGKHIILFLDDLQQYAISGVSISLDTTPRSYHHHQHRRSRELALVAVPIDRYAATLHTLWTAILQGVGSRGKAILVMTCRSADYEKTAAELFRMMEHVELLTISPIPDEQRNTVYLALRQAKPEAHLDETDWDNNIGTALLGLTRKRAEYYTLVTQANPASYVLRAMKLLALAGTTNEQTTRRVRSLAIQVEGNGILENEDVWRSAIQKLVELELLRQEGERLIVFKDVFFECIVDDYLRPTSGGANPQLLAELRRAQHVFENLKDGDALLNLARVWNDCNQYSDLLNAGGKALQYGLGREDASEAHFFLGNADYMLGDYADALTQYEKAFALNPTFTAALYNKGNALYMLKRYSDVLKACEQARELDREDAAIWNLEANAHFARQQYQEALEAREHAIELDPKLEAAWNNKGNALYALKRYNDALDAYDKALMLDRNLAITWDNKGVVLERLKRYEEALLAYDQALKLDPADARSWRNKADLLVEKRHLYADALFACERALALDRTSVRGWRLKGDALKGLARTYDAQQAYEEALMLPADDALSLYNCGRAYAGLQRDADAVLSYQQAIALDPEDADTWSDLAYALHVLFRDDEAIQAEERARAIEP